VYGLTTITGPASEPVTLAVAKAHLRIDHDDENALIEDWIKSARELAEAHTGRRFVTQQVRVTLGAFPCDPDDIIRLPVGPVASVDSLTYTDEAGATQTLAADVEYQAWLDHNPPLLAPPSNRRQSPPRESQLHRPSDNFGSSKCRASCLRCAPEYQTRRWCHVRDRPIHTRHR
jgi:uncharacterized phiE125 gp8 family phage protein